MTIDRPDDPDDETELMVERHRVAVLQRECAAQERRIRALESSLKAVNKIVSPYLRRER
jgi:hypothetical protein